jgi:hypothetical protein
MKISIIILTAFLFCYSCSIQYRTNSEHEIVEEYFEQVKAKPKALKEFFIKMPKGGDIHHHSSGTPYAERYIFYALQDSCYINPKSYQLYCNRRDALEQQDSSVVLINSLISANPNQKDSIIDNWSVRNYKERGLDGHDLFFSTFRKFSPAFVGHESQHLSEICKKASADNISYIESMIRVKNIQDSLAKYASKIQWNIENSTIEEALASLYEQYEDSNIDKWAWANADSLNSYFNRTDKHGIELRFQTYGLRVSSNQSAIFGQLILAFKTTELTDNLVGVNFVAPEDNFNALENYNLHMQMFEFLGKKHPTVNISLHAGELVLGKGSVKKEDIEYHITEALKIANAKRVGHGVDLISETNYETLLEEMKNNNRAVEINLESNEVILETDRTSHPINKYLAYGVPLCICTDDEGVLRTNLNNQYALLVKYVPDISYNQVKQIVYNSIKYSFVKEEKKIELIKELNKRFKTFEQEIAAGTTSI